MSKYTTELRFICESILNLDESAGYNSVENIINNSIDKIFDFNFPLFDTAYKIPLCRKILYHFYTREIGQETYGLWKLKLQTKLNEIMPYYNQLYKSELLEFNPLYDVDITTEHSLKKNQDETKKDVYNDTVDTSKQDNTQLDVSKNVDKTSSTLTKDLDTPQGGIQSINDNYLTNVNDSKTVDNEDNTEKNVTKYTSDEQASKNSTNNYTANINSLDEYIEHIKGKSQGENYSNMLLKFRETFLNIDLMVIEELEELFIQLW